MKVPTALALCAVLCLYGCGAQQPPVVTQQQVLSVLSQPIAAQLTVKSPGLEFEGILNRTGPEVYSFEVTSPQQLEGLTVLAEQQNCSFGYRGMEIELAADLLPSPFGPALLNDAVDELLRQQQPDFQNTSDGGAVLKGELDGLSFQIKFDGTGQPVLFSVPQYDLDITWQHSQLSE